MFNLLSDYIGFIKKALVLLKVYHVIKRVELEVQETEDPSPEESIPPISGSIIVYRICTSPTIYIYIRVKLAPFPNLY